MKLPVPAGLLKQHTIILGMTGAGKSSVMRVFAEHLLEDARREGLELLVRERVCIIDPKGDWWGIKSSANGKDGGLPVAIFGGEHAEVPITPNSGAAVAKIATEAGIPVLIDLGGWMVSERTRFFLDFAPVYFRAKGYRHLIIDEVHHFCPKGKIPDPQVGKMLHWATTLVGEGRGRGISLLAASQRPQKVHNDFLTQCHTLIGMKVSHPADMHAYRDWIDGCGNPAAGKEIMSSVAALPKGTGWVWSVGDEPFGPTRVAFPRFWTYDSFRPQVDSVPLKGWHEVDLGTLREQFAAEIRQAEENDPRLLHKRIRELEQKLAGRTVGASTEELTAEFDRGVRAALEQAEKAAKEERDRHYGHLSETLGILDGVRSRLGNFLALLQRPLERVFVRYDDAPPRQVVSKVGPGAKPFPSSVKVPAVYDESGLTKGQQKILNALAWLEAAGIKDLPRAQLSAIANYGGDAVVRALGNRKTEGF